MDWQSLTADELRIFSDAIIRVARDLGRALPPPPGMPFFGLDMTLCDAAILDRFSEQGIFRKYQRAISLGCGLGGTARWWSARFGCSVLGVDKPPALVAAAARIGAAKRNADVVVQVGDPCALPLRERKFTNAWRAEELTDDAVAFIADAFRVQRPGGFLALRVCSDEIAAETATWCDRLPGGGFHTARRVSLPMRVVSAAIDGAEQRLDAFLAREIPDATADRLRGVAQRMRDERRDRRPSALLLAERPA
jgi:SAM-dependent methyltransferase